MANENTLFFPKRVISILWLLFCRNKKKIHLKIPYLFFCICHKFSFISEIFLTPPAFSHSLFSVLKAFGVLHMVQP